LSHARDRDAERKVSGATGRQSKAENRVGVLFGEIRISGNLLNAIGVQSLPGNQFELCSESGGKAEDSEKVRPQHSRDADCYEKRHGPGHKVSQDQNRIIRQKLACKGHREAL
jgi:hypothetical protein